MSWPKDANLVHGGARRGAKAPEYGVWCNMHRRCTDPKVKGWKNYGGRGIKVCERWNDYANFIADMGPRPTPKHTIERVNNDGDYEPSNCIWATRDVQAKNKRPRKWVKTHCKHGHPLEGDNVWVRPGTRKRVCIKCRKIGLQAWYRRKVNGRSA